MEARADKFLSGHYAYFAELPERVPLELKVKELRKGLEPKKLYELKTEMQYKPKDWN